jgi:hypothetical protein
MKSNLQYSGTPTEGFTIPMKSFCQFLQYLFAALPTSKLSKKGWSQNHQKLSHF